MGLLREAVKYYLDEEFEANRAVSMDTGSGWAPSQGRILSRDNVDPNSVPDESNFGINLHEDDQAINGAKTGLNTPEYRRWTALGRRGFGVQTKNTPTVDIWFESGTKPAIYVGYVEQGSIPMLAAVNINGKWLYNYHVEYLLEGVEWVANTYQELILEDTMTITAGQPGDAVAALYPQDLKFGFEDEEE